MSRGIADALRSLCTDVVTIAPALPRTAEGDATHGPAVSYRARVERRPRLVRSARGLDVLASTTIYLLDDVTVSVEDLVTLATEPQGAVLAVGSSPDERGVRLTTVYLG